MGTCWEDCPWKFRAVVLFVVLLGVTVTLSVKLISARNELILRGEVKR
jgi:hypothetical protein